MDRRQTESKPKGAPAWMITFGDLMALLLTFFVMMLSLSNINQKKYESISAAMGESFGLQKLKMHESHPSSSDKTSLINPPIKVIRDQRPVEVMMKQDLRKEIKGGELTMNEREGKLSITFPDRIAFDSGSATLTPNFVQLLQKVGHILNNTKGPIVVAGYTDNVMIHNSRFKSNWELSSARAVAVVEALIRTGMVEPKRLSAVGYADTRPLFLNDNPELKAKNRRVEIRLDLPE